MTIYRLSDFPDARPSDAVHQQATGTPNPTRAICGAGRATTHPHWFDGAQP